MLDTPRELGAALDALRDATGAACDLDALAVVADVDPHAVRAVLETFTAAVVTIIEGANDAEVRELIAALLAQLDAIRLRAAASRHAA